MVAGASRSPAGWLTVGGGGGSGLLEGQGLTRDSQDAEVHAYPELSPGEARGTRAHITRLRTRAPGTQSTLRL